METVFDALKTMGKATAREIAARLEIEPADALNLLRESEEAGLVTQVNGYWMGVGGSSELQETRPQNLLRSEPVQPEAIVALLAENGEMDTAALASAIGRDARGLSSGLRMMAQRGLIKKIGQGRGVRWTLPDAENGDMSAQGEAVVQVGSDSDKSAVQGESKRFSSTEGQGLSHKSVEEFVKSLPSFTEKRSGDLVVPTLRVANRELRRAKNNVQKWQRVCDALRVLNQHKGIFRTLNGGDI